MKQHEAVPQKPTLPGSAQLMKQREKMEAEVHYIRDQLEHVEIALVKRETKKQELARTEQEKWEEFVGIQRSKQSMVLDAPSKKVVDTRLRSLMEDVVAVSTTLSTLGPEIEEWTTITADYRAQLLPLQEAINNISADIDVMIVQESCIRPHQFYSVFPVNREEIVSLKQHLPCIQCGRYWAEMAFMNLPCGCLLHPICLFQVALSSKPCCPGCNVKPSGGWMGQWGFKSDIASEKATAAALIKEGWAPPLSRIETKLQNAKRKIKVASTHFSSPKRACLPLHKTTALDVEAVGHIDAAADIVATADAHQAVNFGALICEVIGHTKLEVEAGDNMASDTAVVAATSETEVVAVNDITKNVEANVNVAGHHIATSSPTPPKVTPLEYERELLVDISPEVTPLEYGEILNIANAAAGEVDPSTPT